MKYIPDLIPEHYRVDLSAYKDFIKEENTSTGSNNQFDSIAKVFSISLLIAGGLIFFSRPFVGICIFLIGAALSPALHQWLEANLKFSFTRKIKAGLFGILFIAGASANNVYQQQEEQLLLAKQRLEAKQLQEQEELRRQQQIIADSANYYFNEGDSYLSKKNYKQSVIYFTKSLELAPTNQKAFFKRGLCYKSLNNYQNAISDFGSVLNKEENVEALLERAKCLDKLNRRPEAVNDLKRAISLGSDEADKLHEKINPPIKRIIGYVTRCCDGSTSNAKGRGACSHHGGVCNWNDPIYSETRKYQ